MRISERRSLQLEADYQPDGWLGLVQGMDLYYAFYSDEEFEKNMPKLLKLLGENSSVEDTVDGKLPSSVGNLCLMLGYSNDLNRYSMDLK